MTVEVISHPDELRHIQCIIWMPYAPTLESYGADFTFSQLAMALQCFHVNRVPARVLAFEQLCRRADKWRRTDGGEPDG